MRAEKNDSTRPSEAYRSQRRYLLFRSGPSQGASDRKRTSYYQIGRSPRTGSAIPSGSVRLSSYGCVETAQALTQSHAPGIEEKTTAAVLATSAGMNGHHCRGNFCMQYMKAVATPCAMCILTPLSCICTDSGPLMALLSTPIRGNSASIAGLADRVYSDHDLLGRRQTYSPGFHIQVSPCPRESWIRSTPESAQRCHDGSAPPRARSEKHIENNVLLAYRLSRDTGRAESQFVGSCAR
jgi:hypothetical protein